MNPIDPEKLKEILALHGKWLRGEVGGVRADLRYANLQSANLQSADLRYADLRSANLRYADLRYADLRYADLLSANLLSANLLSANLRYANLQSAKYQDDANITGEPWRDYLDRVVPALLTAGGKSIEEVAAVWDCHDWSNCPMAVAFGIHSSEAAPLLLRPRVEQFVQLFDAGLIPRPVAAAEAAQQERKSE